MAATRRRLKVPKNARRLSPVARSFTLGPSEASYEPNRGPSSEVAKAYSFITT